MEISQASKHPPIFRCNYDCVSFGHRLGVDATL